MGKNMKTMDGNAAAAHVSYAFTEVAAIYPITPSSPMAESTDEWSAHGLKNIFGQVVSISELQSEGGAAGAMHGSLSAGALTTTYTASQGLLLMIPNMYKVAGELLPGVYHVSARALAAAALSIFGDHSDVMACRQTGVAMLASSSVQEIMDLGAVTHLSAIKSSLPFLHFFDGFRTSHEIQKIDTLNYDDLAKLVDYQALQKFRDRSLNPERPFTRGTAQNSDVYFQGREASNPYYDALPAIVEAYMAEIKKLTGREYHLFDYYGDPNAENIVIGIGSVCEVLEETVDYLRSKGEKVGALNVHLYRPFSVDHFLKAIPPSVKRIAVLDRTKEPGSLGEPLYLDVCTAFSGRPNAPLIVGGRFGLGSKDTTPTHLKTVFDNLKQSQPKNHFTIAITDDVTHTSLPINEEIHLAAEGVTCCKFWGFGSDGTVGANKDAIKIIGDHTDMYAQAYFAYDSKKSGGVTISHLRFGKSPIKSPYLIDAADFIACHKQAYVDQYDVLEGLKEGGAFLLNCTWKKEELDQKLPASMKRFLAKNKIDFYIIDAVSIAREIGLGNRINQVTQAAFFKLSKVVPLEDAIHYLKDAIQKTYGKKGEKIVSMNHTAVDKGMDALVKIDVPAEWANAQDHQAAGAGKDIPDFVKNVVLPMNAQQGDKLPVSAFKDHIDGSLPHGTAAYEKRGIAVTVPEWQLDNCIQCNQCSYVCPHAAIRPVLLTAEEEASKPAGFETKKAAGKQLEGLTYRMQVSPLDCQGCVSCAEVCPAKEKALVMKDVEDQITKQKDNWEFAVKVPVKANLWPLQSVKGSQFAQPYLEFSGACAGCGETPYAKLVTQLFGERMVIANATGCSSIWGGSSPSTPYTKNAKGQGPAWGNSLFEDNAEYGYGMAVAYAQIRKRLALTMEEAVKSGVPADLSAAYQAWIDGKDNADASKKAKEALLPLLDKHAALDSVKIIAPLKDYLVKPSIWIFGGDGWAYDIGYGGLDHVIASGEDVNILVFDTEVYSNTGGQSSKSTPTGSTAKFAASGKKVKKKDLGMIATTYGYVYVAQVAQGASQNQLIQAISEAEAYPGPSLVIAYAPCINHGLKAGMNKAQDEQKQAVNAGYWHLWRYNPALESEGKNPFVLDSKDPTGSFQDFILGENRYSILQGQFPEIAKVLFAKAEKDAQTRLSNYKRMAQS
ncbi:MAG: pyruvate:ferredoxin (flavodoxin) oxidoreductase [Peptococcaceae bacterium]|jgi:pyruvate-ferredoxin/flavodoxin oxidoreductase|nr:pyruvate:ferredoxin (flavodoxin) oxidoreductase [Peptococcaceae bacterium]